MGIASELMDWAAALDSLELGCDGSMRFGDLLFSAAITLCVAVINDSMIGYSQWFGLA
jgi:hypothetical protein